MESVKGHADEGGVVGLEHPPVQLEEGREGGRKGGRKDVGQLRFIFIFEALPLSISTSPHCLRLFAP